MITSEDTKTCAYCKRVFTRPVFISQNRFATRKYCNQRCYLKANYRQRKLKYTIFEFQYAPPYERVDNRTYHQQLSEITGLSRMYLDGEVNLDTLRIMEIEMKQHG